MRVYLFIHIHEGNDFELFKSIHSIHHQPWAVASPERARAAGLARITRTSGKPTIIREDTYTGSLPNYLYMYIAYRSTGDTFYWDPT